VGVVGCCRGAFCVFVLRVLGFMRGVCAVVCWCRLPHCGVVSCSCVGPEVGCGFVVLICGCLRLVCFWLVLPLVFLGFDIVIGVFGVLGFVV